MHKAVTHLFFLICLTLSNSTLADHLPEELLATGRPERVLGGIQLKQWSGLAQVSRTHGEPTRHESIGAEEHYFWEKGGMTLHLVVDRGLSKPGDEQILMIEVEGEKSSWMAQTGAGLRLGDDINRVSKIYGKKFHLRNIPELDIYDVQIQWKKDESATLLAEFDSQGKIRKFYLCLHQSENYLPDAPTRDML